MTQAAKTPPGRRTSESKRHLKHVVQNDTTTSALANPTASTTKPTGNVIDLNDHAAARVFFGGTDGANETINYQILLWYLMDDGNGKQDWIPRIVATGVATLSAMAMPVNYQATNGLMADSITDTIDDDGSVEESPADDTVAMLYIKCRGAALLEIETDLGTAAAADAWVQLGE